MILNVIIKICKTVYHKPDNNYNYKSSLEQN